MSHNGSCFPRARHSARAVLLGSDSHGLPLIPYSVEFSYDDRYRPGATIRFVVADLVYGKHALTSDEETWRRGTYGHHFYLPVRVLPDDFT